MAGQAHSEFPWKRRGLCLFLQLVPTSVCKLRHSRNGTNFFLSSAFYYSLVFMRAGERSVISVYSGFSPFLGVVAAYQECQNADVGVYVKQRVEFGTHDSSFQSARSLPTHWLSYTLLGAQETFCGL